MHGRVCATRTKNENDDGKNDKTEHGPEVALAEHKGDEVRKRIAHGQPQRETHCEEEMPPERGGHSDKNCGTESGCTQKTSKIH